MATVTGYTAQRMKQIEDSTVVDGRITPNQRLVLTQRDGTEIDTGSVAATAKLGVADTPSVDMILNGIGSDEDPWIISAKVKSLVGLLDANYKGVGPAKVKVGDVLSTDAYSWLTPYQPNGSRLVRLQQFDNKYCIMGQLSDEAREIPLAAGWATHVDANANSTFNLRVRANRLTSGLVVLAGMVQYSGTPATTTLICTLPEDCRPNVTLMMPVITGDLPRAILVHPDGRVEVRGTWPANSYLSLDNVAFYAANTVEWLPIGGTDSPWGANFQALTSNPAYGVPSYYKDPYGFVWIQGMIQLKNAVSADNTPIFTLPSGYNSPTEQHFRAVGNDQYASVGTLGNNVVWKAGTNSTTAGSWMSLSGMTLITADALANNPWYIPSATVGGWVAYPGNFSTLGFLRREDGLAISKGFVRSGTLGSRMAVVPEELWPSGGRLIFACTSGGASGRLEIGAAREADTSVMSGGVIPRSGANNWFSLDSLKWVP